MIVANSRTASKVGSKSPGTQKEVCLSDSVIVIKGKKGPPEDGAPPIQSKDPLMTYYETEDEADLDRFLNGHHQEAEKLAAGIVGGQFAYKVLECARSMIMQGKDNDPKERSSRDFYLMLVREEALSMKEHMHDLPAGLGTLERSYSPKELLGLYQSTRQDIYFNAFIEQFEVSAKAFLKQFIKSEGVDDVFQEASKQVFLSIDTYDTNRNPRPWFFTILANKAKDYLRKEKRLREREKNETALKSNEFEDGEDPLALLAVEETRPLDELVKTEGALEVLRTIGELNEKLRKIILLAYFKGRSYKEMANILEIPIGTVKSRLHTAVKRFGKEWEHRHKPAID